MNTFIEMYNADHYFSWEDAARYGGVYSSIVHMVDDPDHPTSTALLEDVMEAAHNAARMMDSNARIETRVVRRAV